MKISFLLVDRCHIGGVVSAIHNLAGALADDHEVELVALRRSLDRPFFPLDPRVKTIALTDRRKHSHTSDLDDPLNEVFPHIYPNEPADKKPWVSRLAEKRLMEYLATTDADVVVSTNPKITIMLAYAEGDYFKVATEHSRPAQYGPHIRDALFRDAYPKMDAITAPTPDELETIAHHVPGVSHMLSALPNCIPAHEGQMSTGENKIVVAAGLLKSHKGFADLIEAFSTVAPRHPDWSLRIYGSGPERANLRKKINETGSNNQVFLMGPATPVTPEFAKASLFVLPSRLEAFGNVTVEAMAAGLPAICYDAPHGPRNIIRQGEDGYVVPVGDKEALAEHIEKLISDDDLRRKMAAAAVANVVRFQEAATAERFEKLVEGMRARRAVPREAGAVVTPQGDVQVRVDGLAGDAELVCKNIRKKAEDVVLPFVGGEALIPTLGKLVEGDWQLTIRAAGAELPLRSAGCDTLHILSLEHPRTEGPALSLLLPYAHTDGTLRVQSRVRAQHVEVAAVKADATSIVVDAAAWGVELGTDSVIEAVHRKEADKNFTFPVKPGADGRFTATLDNAAAARLHKSGTEDVWDLWLLPDRKSARVRICKLATDVLVPMDVFTFPYPVVKSSGASVAAAAETRPKAGGWRGRLGVATAPAATAVADANRELRPYFASNGQLSLKIIDKK
ncbi:glycosyltransferase family 4 protein [Streptomyces sp. NPDC056528]|uniref:glycosyltransferase family 4 protein n=1 Tax=Streptomyces sp. NPDC056528 TaxID=3345854 RepID=UPI0036AFA560